MDTGLFKILPGVKKKTIVPYADSANQWILNPVQTNHDLGGYAKVAMPVIYRVPRLHVYQLSDC